MSFTQNANGLGVKQTFGAAERGDTVIAGGYVSTGPLQTIVVAFDYADLQEDFLEISLLKGAQVVDASLYVETGFVGAGATLEIGTKGSEATNGISWPVAGIGTANRTVAGASAAGTWVNPLAADTAVGVMDSGAVFTAGKGKITLTYRV